MWPSAMPKQHQYLTASWQQFVTQRNSNSFESCADIEFVTTVQYNHFQAQTSIGD
jgi:hypothetical protein